MRLDAAIEIATAEFERVTAEQAATKEADPIDHGSKPQDHP